ncbi:MAG TPA: DUF421 domain-containing protein [Candidatus Avoscillospira avistercoris]|uniref:DUF421 domain-containing protein n=1 Tax=Candidatus Avoscillospira avistercoris TaxID=2840707 RepID=A0A9D1JSU4_9FIRM|nr:DUF421 domain-containing protein [Candidatus Avoscillospira avistercoris]
MFISYIRTIILYVLLIAAVRLMGKRQLGELEPTEFVVAILIADLASVPMQDIGIPLFAGVIPILTVLSIELIFSVLSVRFRPVRKFLSGNPVMLMENGQILVQNLMETRLTVDELIQHLRAQGILDLSTVQYALMEVDGKISAILDPKYQPPTAQDLQLHVDAAEMPVAVISDGVILDDQLEASGRNRAWLDKQLRHFGCTAEEVFLLTATKSGKLYLCRQEVDA